MCASRTPSKRVLSENAHSLRQNSNANYERVLTLTLKGLSQFGDKLRQKGNKERVSFMVETFGTITGPPTSDSGDCYYFILAEPGKPNELTQKCVFHEFDVRPQLRLNADCRCIGKPIKHGQDVVFQCYIVRPITKVQVRCLQSIANAYEMKLREQFANEIQAPR